MNGDENPSTSPQSIVHPCLFCCFTLAMASLLRLTANPLHAVLPPFESGSDLIPRGKQANGNGLQARKRGDILALPLRNGKSTPSALECLEGIDACLNFFNFPRRISIRQLGKKIIKLLTGF
ncbi:MAG: hypothetical protein ACYC5X_18545 [Syntrophales bacterium]